MTRENVGYFICFMICCAPTKARHKYDGVENQCALARKEVLEQCPVCSQSSPELHNGNIMINLMITNNQTTTTTTATTTTTTTATTTTNTNNNDNTNNNNNDNNDNND